VRTYERCSRDSLARHRIETSQSTTIDLVAAGTGEGLLLLHGCPETLVMWHEIAPAFADDFAVVASDLRGYGDSSKPHGSSDHGTYSFRAMARDQVEVMTPPEIRRSRGTARTSPFQKPPARAKKCMPEVMSSRAVRKSRDG